MTSSPWRVIRCLVIDSISSGGQPWKVERVTVSAIRAGKSMSRNRANSPPIWGRSRSISSRASIIESMNQATRSVDMPARS